MEELTTNTTGKGWSVDRQFRFVLGILLAIFLAGYPFSPMFAIIPVVLSLGLTVTAIIDKCYLRIGIVRLPWNSREEVALQYGLY